MPLNGLDIVFKNGLDLIPHIEEAAFHVIRRDFTMPQLVTRLTDMRGWNARKVSEYLPSGMAGNIDEDTDIPDSVLARARKNTVEPDEVGDRYRISDRRVDTDLENILSDITEALGYSIGSRVEYDLIHTALNGFMRGTIGGSAVNYSSDLCIDAMYEFTQRAQKMPLVNVIHPFQAKKALKDLMQFTTGTNLDYRNEAIRTWQVPTVGNVSIAVSSTLPRRVINKLAVYGTGGTFRLAVMSGIKQGVEITADIAVNTTIATMRTNVETALNALTFVGNGTWTVTGATLADMTVTPPANLYLQADHELRVALDYANPTAQNWKSNFDDVTGATGGPLDQNGVMLGVQVFERVGSTCKSLFFTRGAILLDVRKPLSTNYEKVHQGRTAEYAMFTTYGSVVWKPEEGMFIETKAESAQAVA